MSSNVYDEAGSAVDVTHSPATLSAGLAVGAGLLAVLTGGIFTGLALVIGLFGLIGVAAGLFAVESRGLTTAGTGVIFLAVLASGVFGSPPPVFLMTSMLMTILAFDLGQNAFSVGAQMSDQTETGRGELVHAAASLGVGVVGIVLAYAIFLMSFDSASIVGVMLTLLAAILLAWAVRS